MTWLFRVGLALAAAGALSSAWPSHDVVDTVYAPAAVRSFGRFPPRVAIDEAHLNADTATGRFSPFTRVLARDGYRVTPFVAPFSARSLAYCDVLVIANALGWRGLVQRAINGLGLEGHVDFDVRAFSADEVRSLDAWVRAGGNLLLIADEAPAAAAAAEQLADALGVRVNESPIHDSGRADASSEDAGVLLFSRSRGLLDTAIARGRAPAERVERVATFVGQAIEAPPDAMTLLQLSSAARELPGHGSRENNRSAAGMAQAVAFRHGTGRVVVAGESTGFTALRRAAPNGQRKLFGINRAGNDNRQFVLNVMHWLSGALE